MKRSSIFLFLLCCYSLTSRAQHSCCSPQSNVYNAQTAMQVFASDPQFVKQHLDPLPFKGELAGGQMISFACPDGKNASAYVVLHGKDSSKILLMFHEWWGLNDYIKQEAERMSKELGVMVVAVDLYDGQVASVAEEASKLIRGLKPERAMAIIGGAYSHFPAESHYATIGWCMGGTWSMQAALNPAQLSKDDKRIIGCVLYYGMPETDQAKLERLHCPVLGVFGTQDQNITPTVVADFQTAMKTAKKKVTVHNYNAAHGFANPSNPKYDNVATEDAMKHTIEFLKKRFGSIN